MPEHPLNLFLPIRHLLLLPLELFHALRLLLLQAPAHAIAGLLVVLRAVLAVDVLLLALLLLTLLFSPADVLLVVRVGSVRVRIVRIVLTHDVLQRHELEHLVERVARVAVHDVKSVPRRTPAGEHRAPHRIRVLLARVLPGEQQPAAARLLRPAELVVVLRGRADGDVRVTTLGVRVGAPPRDGDFFRLRHRALGGLKDAPQHPHRRGHQGRRRFVGSFHRLRRGPGDEPDEDVAAARLLQVPKHEHPTATAD